MPREHALKTAHEPSSQRMQTIALRRDQAETATAILSVLTTDRFEQAVLCRADGSGPLESITG